jgi:hypothetical protein
MTLGRRCDESVGTASRLRRTGADDGPLSVHDDVPRNGVGAAPSSEVAGFWMSRGVCVRGLATPPAV